MCRYNTPYYPNKVSCKYHITSVKEFDQQRDITSFKEFDQQRDKKDLEGNSNNPGGLSYRNRS